jgi:hypothetical protein
LRVEYWRLQKFFNCLSFPSILSIITSGIWRFCCRYVLAPFHYKIENASKSILKVGISIAFLTRASPLFWL